MISRLEFVIDKIFVKFEHFEQIVGISMGTNCEPLLSDLFLFSMRRSSFWHLSKTRRSQKPDPLISHSGILMKFFQLKLFRLGTIKISSRTGHFSTRIDDKRDVFNS